MNVLVACERVDAEGGTETYLRALLPALAARGHAVCVVARTVARAGAYGVRAECVAWNDEHDPPNDRAAQAAGAIAQAFAPDVVAVHNVLDSGIVTTLRKSSPRLVYHVHDHRPFCPNGDRLYPQGGGICGVRMGTQACGWHSLINGCAYGPRPGTLELIRRRQALADAVRAADATIAFSRYIGALARLNGVAPERLDVIAPPLDDASFAPVASRPRPDAVLFSGRVVPSKGARSLVRALATLPDGERPLLRIAGEGPDLPATLAEAGARGVAAEALGRLDAPALRSAYDAATLVAMPSLWGEPFGLVGIEAFARGRPVAAYDAGAIGEWLVPNGGRLVRRGDERALGLAIRALLDAENWDNAAGCARDASQAYRLDAHVDRIEAAYGGRRS